MRIVSAVAVLLVGVMVGGWLVGQGRIPPEILSFVGLNPEATSRPPEATPAKTGEKEVLYWVAPMDATYRRDKPGKSPMGMDLIPVYADSQAGEGDADVVISAAIVNNLGVRTALVKIQSLERRIDTVGYVTFDETNISHIHLRTDGWIENLVVKAEGERVHKGQQLFEFYSPTLVNAQEEFLQSVSSRNKPLIQASELRLRSLGLTDQQIKFIRQSGKVRQSITIQAPQAGIVSELNVRQGMRVTPNMNILTLADLSHVWLQTEVVERQADWVTLGGRAEATLAYLPGQTWKGSVDYIYPTLTAKTRTLKVRLRFDNPEERMKPNMYAKVAIFSAAKKDCLVIPREAVIRSGHGERIILALGEGHYKARRIRTGMESDGLVEVLSGLEQGEKVVTSSQFLIDSQASLSGSLDRLDDTKGSEGREEGMDPPTEPEAAPPPKSASIASVGILRQIMADEHKVKLSHEPIPALRWPAMTMDFSLASGVNIDALHSEQKVTFQLQEVGPFEYEITEIKAASEEHAP